MDTKEIKLDDGTILTPVKPPFSEEQLQKASEMMNSSEYQNFAANQIKEQTYKNLGFNEKPEQPKNVMVEKQSETNELLESTNEQILELQNKLDDATLQLIESNNKIEEQNNQISELKNQLNETGVDKAKHKISDIIVGALGGVLTAVMLYFIAKFSGISF